MYCLSRYLQPAIYTFRVDYDTHKHNCENVAVRYLYIRRTCVILYCTVVCTFFFFDSLVRAVYLLHTINIHYIIIIPFYLFLYYSFLAFFFLSYIISFSHCVCFAWAECHHHHRLCACIYICITHIHRHTRADLQCINSSAPPAEMLNFNFYLFVFFFFFFLFLFRCPPPCYLSSRRRSHEI